MKRIKELMNKPWAPYTVATCSAVLFYFLLSNLGHFASGLATVKAVLSPVIIGIIIACLINPVVNFFEQKVFKKIKKPSARHTLSVIITVLIILICLSVLVATLIPSLVSSVSNLIANKDRYIASAEEIAENFGSKFFKIDASNLTQKLNESVDGLMDTVYRNMSTILAKLKGVGTGVSNFTFGFIFAVCFLLGKKSLTDMLDNIRRSYMNEKRYTQSSAFWTRCHGIFEKYLSCTVIDGIIIGIINAVFMAVTGLPYVALISVLVGVTNLIPTVGPIIGGAIGAFILVLNKPVYALYFLIFTVILQTIDAMVVKPKLFSGSLGLPAIWTIVAITIGGKIAGIIGIILSIPVATILLIMYKEFAVPWMKKRREKLNGKNTQDVPPEPSEESENYDSE